MDCTQYSHIIEFFRATGPTLGITGAIVAWIANKSLGWVVWAVERFLKRHELMKALLAEVESNRVGELSYFPKSKKPTGVRDHDGRMDPDDYILSLADPTDPNKLLAPYVAVVASNPVYESAVASLSILPDPVVKPLVRYYARSVALMNQLSDFRSEPYLALSIDRQRVVISRVWSLLGQAVEATSEEATETLKSTIEHYEFVIRYSKIVLVLAGIVVALTSAISAPSVFDEFRQAAEWVRTCHISPISQPNTAPI